MIVSNATPLINFGAIRRLDILERLFHQLIIPLAVKQELFEKGILYPSTATLEAATFLETRVVQNVNQCESLKVDLNEGEAEAIALALELNAALLLIDEVEGRRVAASYQIPFTGSIGCLVQAKKQGIIVAIKPLIDAMQTTARFWVSHQLYQTILAENNE